MNRQQFLAATASLLLGSKFAKLEALAPPTLIFPTGTFVSNGGLCAPLTPLYDIPLNSRPLRDALPTFTAIRGETTFVEVFE